MAVHAGSVHRHPALLRDWSGRRRVRRQSDRICHGIRPCHPGDIGPDLDHGLVWTGFNPDLAILAALRLAFFSANKLFAADGDWGTVSETEEIEAAEATGAAETDEAAEATAHDAGETNKTTTTTDDAEAQA